MKLGTVVVALLTMHQEVLASLRHGVAVQLDVQLAQVGHQPDVTFLLYPTVLQLILIYDLYTTRINVFQTIWHVSQASFIFSELCL